MGGRMSMRFDIRNTSTRDKERTEIKSAEDLPPLYYMKGLYKRMLAYDKFLGIEEDGATNQKKIMLRLQMMRVFAKLLKPLLRFENLFSYITRRQIEINASHSMTPEIWYANIAGHGFFKEWYRQICENNGNPEKPVVWLEWCLSTEIVYAFDALPIIPETLVAIPLLMMGLEPNQVLLDHAEQSGVPQEYCSAARSAIGACLTRQYPDPTCIVTVSHPCDSMVSSYQTIEYLTNAPIYRLDTPYWDDTRSLDYYTEEIKGLIVFLEKQLNRRLDYDRLREMLTEVNKTNELLMEINEMCRAEPCPGSGYIHVLTWLAGAGGRGMPEVTEVARRMHDVIRKRLEKGKGAVKKEKIRVIWFDVPIVFYPLMIWMEETFGASVVVDLVGYVNTPPIDTSTPESMRRGLAESYMNLTMARQFHGTIQLFHRDVQKVCREYNGDCFIFAGHAGCKHGWASVRILKEELKKINMPLLVLTSDIFDIRMTNETKLKAQIEEFFITNGLC